MPVVPSLGTDRYYSYQDLADYMRSVEAAAPHLVRLYSIGTSTEGRPLLMAEVTNRGSGEGADKPALWLDGNLHAAEVLGSMACLETLSQLASGHGRDEFVTHLLDTRTFYLVPRLAVDGAEYCLATGDVVRSGVRMDPFEDERPGLSPADVNGDGQVLQMRLEDPLGEWKVSRRDPRLMLPRSPEDRTGPFYRVYREGFFEQDRVRTGPRRRGVDFDRNFPYAFQPGEGAGPFPLSEPETRAVADFVRNHPNLVASLSCHSSGGTVLYPYAHQGSEHLPPRDRQLFEELGRRATEVTGYAAMSAFEGFPAPGGRLDDWLYHDRGILAFRTKLWSIARAAGLEVLRPQDFEKHRSEAESLSLLRWLDREFSGQGFVNWTPWDHPQLGRIEVGGWQVLNTWINPPPGVYLREEVQKHARLAMLLAAALPRVAIRSLREEVVGWSERRRAPRTGPGVPRPADSESPSEAPQPLRRVVLEVENQGYLPTWGSQRSLELGRRYVLGVLIELSQGVELTVGRARQEFAGLSGTGAAHCAPGGDTVWFGGSEDHPRETFEWLVRGGGEVRLTARGDRAGLVRMISRMTAEEPPAPPAPPPVRPARPGVAGIPELPMPPPGAPPTPVPVVAAFGEGARGGYPPAGGAADPGLLPPGLGVAPGLGVPGVMLAPGSVMHPGAMVPGAMPGAVASAPPAQMVPVGPGMAGYPPAGPGFAPGTPVPGYPPGPPPPGPGAPPTGPPSGRVLGSPPSRPGVVPRPRSPGDSEPASLPASAGLAQEDVQLAPLPVARDPGARPRHERSPMTGRGVAPQASPQVPVRPTESPASAQPPVPEAPEAPPVASKIPTPLLLRRLREKK